MSIQDLTAEQMERARGCKGRDELAAFAKAEGVELTDEQLDGFSGGEGWQCSQDQGQECNGFVCVRVRLVPESEPSYRDQPMS